LIKGGSNDLFEIVSKQDRGKVVTYQQVLKMKSILVSLICSCMLLSACTAIEKYPQKFEDSGWSSSDPLSIPFNIRQSQFKAGNLVANFSFEEGRRTDNNNFDLDGWQPIGSGVSWVRQKTGSRAAREINTGQYAVKILRTAAQAADEAAGVISDYLPVIPGNYDFTFHIRLKDVRSHQGQPELFPGNMVAIRMLFFDKNRLPLDPMAPLPVRNTPIDTSDKAYAFSQLRRIDNFGWHRVRGRSYQYPMSEGDIPDATRYVRLFIGLKGSGTMWIDDVDLRYSKWNFTTLERFRPYFTRRLRLEEKITPTPHRFQSSGKVVYYDAREPDAKPPLIVLPGDPAPAELSAAVLVQKEINTILSRVSPARPLTCAILRTTDRRFSLEDIREAPLVMSIGRNRLYRQFQPEFPLDVIRDKIQGYIINSRQIGDSHIVFLVGRTPVASFYAAATAVQLLEPDRGVYHAAAVIDYPDFLSRSFAFKKWQNKRELDRDLENIDGMSRYKLNRVYVSPMPARKLWQNSVPVYLEGIQAAGRLCSTGGTMNLAVMANPYSHFDFFPSVENLSDEDRYLWTHSNPESLTLLQNFFKVGLEAGADTIMYLADDFVPSRGGNRHRYSLYTTEDENRFGTLANAQAHVINRLKKWIDRDYPGTRLEFCPPWYATDFINHSNGEAQKYFKALIAQIPRDVDIVWTGPAVRSLSIDMADIQRYRSIIGRWPLVWDNTLYARSIANINYGGYTAHYPGKVRMCNLFEPFDTYRPEGFHRYSSHGRIYTNGRAYRDTYRIKFATVADYLWNTAGYDPELSLWKVLTRTYGKACARDLIYFNDAYFGLYQVNLRMKTEGRREADIQQGKEFIQAMAGYLKQLEDASCATQTLVAELKNLRGRQTKRFDKLAGFKENRDPAQGS
jgi:hypothetical protein